MKKNHYCGECLLKVLLGFAEKGVCIKRNPDVVATWNTKGLKCELCHRYIRTTYGVSFPEEMSEVGAQTLAK